MLCAKINMALHKVYKVEGMSCAACALKIQKALAKIEGVSNAQVALLQERVSLDLDKSSDSKLVLSCVEDLGYKISDTDAISSDAIQSGSAFDKDLVKLIVTSFLCSLLMLFSMGPMFSFYIVDNAYGNALLQCALTAVIMYVQRHYFISGFKAILSKSANMDTLVALGSLISFIYSLVNTLLIDKDLTLQAVHHSLNLYYESAAMILTLISIGKYIEHKARVKTKDALDALVSLAPKTCRKIVGDRVLIVDAASIKKDDIIELKAGDSIGADGYLKQGSLSLDARAITGESLPQSVTCGDKVLSGCSVHSGYGQIQVTRSLKDSTLFEIIALVDKASAQKPDIARLADKIASIFVPAILIIALITFIVWYLKTSSLPLAFEFCVSVLVISCPCALGLATPTAIMVGTGLAARHGILFKSAKVIERLRLVDTVFFDKTGTLTQGSFKLLFMQGLVDALEPFYNQLVLSLEHKSSHLIATSLQKALKAQTVEVSDYSYKEGEGVFGTIFGTQYAFVNVKSAQRLGVTIDTSFLHSIDMYEKRGCLCLLLCDKDKVIALYVLGDSIKGSAYGLIDRLHKMHIKCTMLTGDGKSAAAYVASELCLDDYKYELLPKDKAFYIQSEQDNNKKVCFAGDGINDAPALASAFVGVGLKGASDIAIASCDVVLMQKSLHSLVNAIEISKRTVRNIKENLFWAFFYNIIAIPVACGVFYSADIKLNPMLCALLMSISSICVVLNALRLSFINLRANEDNNQRQENAKAGEIKMHKEIFIEGMSCSHCTSSVHKALSSLPGVENLEVVLDEKKASFDLNSALDDAMLKSVVESLGFKVSAIK